jgi:hypothetical protein
MNKERVVRIRIHPLLMKRYKVVCLDLDLSIPKQTTELIRKFVEIQEQNMKLMKHLEK